MRRVKFRTNYSSMEEAFRQIAAQLNNEPTFSVTLASGTASTAVSNQMVGKDSYIGLMPTTANAAAENVYVSERGDGTFTLSHSNAATGDRTFTYTIFG